MGAKLQNWQNKRCWWWLLGLFDLTTGRQCWVTHSYSYNKRADGSLYTCSITRWIWALHLHIPSWIATWNITKFMYSWCQSGLQLRSNGHAWKQARSKVVVSTETIWKRNITFSLSQLEVHISPHHITTFLSRLNMR